MFKFDEKATALVNKHSHDERARLRDDITQALREAYEAGRKECFEKFLRCREGLEAIAADGWTEGQKNRGEFKGMSEEEIAKTVLRDIEEYGPEAQVLSEGRE